jgi:hypothetical protein
VGAPGVEKEKRGRMESASTSREMRESAKKSNIRVGRVEVVVVLMMVGCEGAVPGSHTALFN